MRVTSERVEAGDLVGRELRWIREELLEPNGLVVSAIVEKLVEELERRQEVLLFQQEIHHAVAQRRSLHVHRRSLAPTDLRFFFFFARILKTLITLSPRLH